jgi:hypothetical protein
VIVPFWHPTIALFLLKLDEFFILLVPSLVVAGKGGGNGISFPNSEISSIDFPSEPDGVQKILSIKTNFVPGMKAPLRMNPLP